MTASRRTAALGAVLGLVLLAAPPAGASSETLKRSFQNMLMCPFDVALSPIVAGKTVYQNLRDVDDSTAVKVFYPLPGYAWTTAVQIGAGVLRGVSGALELLPGLGLLFFENDLDPLFDPAVDNDALIEWDNPVLNIKMGVDYTSTPF